jgi:alanyl-tRNA synthetase
MTSTPRLYFDDPLLFRFDARVVGHATFAERPSVVLDRTAFYPEAGGQMADAGALSGARVIDVQVDDAGVVHHVIEGALPGVGASVAGEIDARRRRLHMALHTGQHMLSRALADVARAETVSSRLGESLCTIDLDREKLDERQVAEAEELVNSVVDDDVTIRAWFPAENELAALPLRRKPKVARDVRVVEIGAFDVSPCGGTHCTSSAQVGLVRVTGLERYKGGMRVLFAAGPRARRELSAHDDALRALARSFTCGPKDVGLAIDKVRRELDTTRDALGKTRARLADASARSLVAEAEASGDLHVVAVFDEGGLDMLRAVAARLVARDGVVALLAAKTDEGVQILVDRGKGSAFDCGGFVKRVAASAGGRGGGRPDHAEGRLPAGVDWPALVRDHR